MIQCGHDFFEFLPGDLSEVSVFGEKLADKTIGVFVQSSFPGRIGMRKVDSCVEILGHALRITKFPTIVIRHRLHTSLVRSELTGDRLPDCSGSLVLDTFEHRILGFPFPNRHEDTTMALADDGNPLPGTNAFTSIRQR